MRKRTGIEVLKNEIEIHYDEIEQKIEKILYPTTKRRGDVVLTFTEDLFIKVGKEVLMKHDHISRVHDEGYIALALSLYFNDDLSADGGEFYRKETELQINSVLKNSNRFRDGKFK